MAQHHPTLGPIRYNAAEQCYEALISYHDGDATQHLACSVPGSLSMSPHKVRHLLIAEGAARLRDRRGLRSTRVARKVPVLKREETPRLAPAGWLRSVFSPRAA